MTRDEERDELDRIIDELEAEVLEELGMTREDFDEQRQQEEDDEEYPCSCLTMDLPTNQDTIH